MLDLTNKTKKSDRQSKRKTTDFVDLNGKQIFKSALDVEQSSEDSEDDSIITQSQSLIKPFHRSKSANYQGITKYKKRFTSDNYQVKKMEIKRNASEIGLPEKKVFINRYNRNMKLYTMYKNWIFSFRCQQLFSFLGLTLAGSLFFIRQKDGSPYFLDTKELGCKYDATVAEPLQDCKGKFNLAFEESIETRKNSNNKIKYSIMVCALLEIYFIIVQKKIKAYWHENYFNPMIQDEIIDQQESH